MANREDLSRGFLPLIHKNVEAKSTVSGKMLYLFSALLLAAFVCMKSILSILLEKSSGGGKRYPFVIQTVTLCAFVMQMIFYTWQTTLELGFKGGIKAVVGSYEQMGPAVFYSTLVALSTLLQSMSQSYIEASLYIILMQMTMVLVALGDRFVIGKVSNLSLWTLVVVQASIVISYTMVTRSRTAASAEETPPASTEQTASTSVETTDRNGVHQVIGIALCLLAETCSAFGSILQQRFMQVAAPDLLTSIKLFYQHLFGAIVMTITFLLTPSDIARVLEEGFFVGWSTLTVATACCMWLYFLVASSVTAYVSALAGAMGASVVIGVVALYEVNFLGKSLGPLHVALMGALFCNTGLYTVLKDRQNKRLIESDMLSEEHCGRLRHILSQLMVNVRMRCCSRHWCPTWHFCFCKSCSRLRSCGIPQLCLQLPTKPRSN